MIVLGVGRNSRESPIMFRQVLFLQKHIGLCMRPDFLATHLLHQRSSWVPWFRSTRPWLGTVVAENAAPLGTNVESSAKPTGATHLV